MSLPEIRHLITRLIWPPEHDPQQVLGWSHWRRKHQARARRCHYVTRGTAAEVRL